MRIARVSFKDHGTRTGPVLKGGTLPARPSGYMPVTASASQSVDWLTDRPWLVTAVAAATMLLSPATTATGHESLLIELAPSGVIASECWAAGTWMYQASFSSWPVSYIRRLSVLSFIRFLALQFRGWIFIFIGFGDQFDFTCSFFHLL